MKTALLERTLFGHSIRMALTPLDDGLHVLLEGGQRGHVGAVALAREGAVLATAVSPGHKEQAVAERWAAALSRAAGVPAAVACGIHYDNATRAQIEAILRLCEELLAETIQIIETGEQHEL
ncbi:MAG: hypothetical protein ACI4OI_03810 [Gemmiger sp.]